MTIIGLTGGSGGGKSTALRTLAALGAEVIDCDALYHELLTSGGAMVTELSDRFPGVVTDGVLDRKALGQIVFHDPDALADLNAITHRHVCDAVDIQIADCTALHGTLMAIEAIALIESGLGSRCTTIVGVLAPAERRAERIMAREGLDHAYATARLESQKPDAFFREHCDYIIENDYPTPEAFAAACQTQFMQVITEGGSA